MNILPDFNPLKGLTKEQQEAVKKLAEKVGVTEQLKAHGIIPSESEVQLSKFITEDELMQRVKQDIRLIIHRPEPVLIRGETGTGKEILAKALHGNRKGKFVGINITNLPSELLESELFGHIEGSFTGASKTKVGLMEHANNGTLFLDEIGDMPLPAQAKLLRVLQEKTIRRVGDVNEMAISCRIVCATRRNLEEMVKKETFRDDLYWRLNMFQLHTTPLRERKDDVREILHACYDPEAKIPDEVIDKWIDGGLHGNVRELEGKALRYLVWNRS